MQLPAEIPDLLKARAVPLGEGVGAELLFRGRDVLEVIQSLAATRVAILGGRVYRSRPWGVARIDEGWDCEPEPGEPALDFADRSRRSARGYVETWAEDHAGEALFLLTFGRPRDPL